MERGADDQNVDQPDDPESRPLVNRQPPRQQQPALSSWQDDDDAKRDPRNETFLQAMHLNLCPQFTLCSVLCFLSVIEVIVFGAELYLGGLSNSSFLGASPSALDLMGEKVSRCNLIVP